MNRLASILLLSAAVALPTASEAAEHGPSSGVQWKWPAGETRRWYIEDEVVLPSYMFWQAEYNVDLRVAAWQLKMVMTCSDPQAEGKRSIRFDCKIDDLGLRAAAVPADQVPDPKDTQGRTKLQRVVDEMDAKVTGATLQIGIRDDGRLVDVDLEGVDKHNRRTAYIEETLRLVLARAIAGLDLQLPRHGDASDGVWAQFSTWLLMTPAMTGSAGGSETLHRVYQVRDDGKLVIQTAGKGIITAGEDDNQYDTRLEGVSVFDVTHGMLTERIWTALGNATAGSAVSEGFASSPPYAQRGRLELLAPGDPAPDVGDTREIALPGQSISTLQQWVPFPDLPSQSSTAPPP